MVRFIVDTHVHVYPMHSIDSLLTAAYSNLDRLDPAAAKVLFVLETDLTASNLAPNHWLLEELDAPMVRATSKRWEAQMLLVLGTQYTTKEGLEFVHLGPAVFEQNLPIRYYVDNFSPCQMAYVPWGFGKWWGERKSLIADLPKYTMFGDSFGRPVDLDGKTVDRLRIKHGPLLSGTDPLPLAGEEKYVGRFASSVEASSYVALLERDTWQQAACVGKRSRLAPAAWRQIRMNLC